jgi:hypothetical protein
MENNVPITVCALTARCNTAIVNPSEGQGGMTDDDLRDATAPFRHRIALIDGVDKVRSRDRYSLGIEYYPIIVSAEGLVAAIQQIVDDEIAQGSCYFPHRLERNVRVVFSLS